MSSRPRSGSAVDYDFFVDFANAWGQQIAGSRSDDQGDGEARAGDPNPG